tara:strand:- start:2609 stop:3088 length:480 start_codon:yes stop_codon:yes gene_type:complete
MKNLHQIIKEEVKSLKLEQDIKRYPIPPEIIVALEDKLKMNPIIRFVKDVKAVNSIPPSYKIILHNDQYFDIYYEDFSLMLRIQAREYYLMDLEERSNAIEHINRLMTIRPVPSVIPSEEDEDEDIGDVEDDTGDTTPPPPPEDDEPEELGEPEPGMEA